MRRALANRLGLPLGLEVQGILCYGKMGLFNFFYYGLFYLRSGCVYGRIAV